MQTSMRTVATSCGRSSTRRNALSSFSAQLTEVTLSLMYACLAGRSPSSGDRCSQADKSTNLGTRGKPEFDEEQIRVPVVSAARSTYVPLSEMGKNQCSLCRLP